MSTQDTESRIPVLKKYGALSFLSEEQLYQARAFLDERFIRKHSSAFVEPAKEVWARYYAAKNALRILNEYEFTDWGGPEYEPEVTEPSPTREVTYLETHEEWLERCRALYKGEIA